MATPGQRVFDRLELLARLGGGGEAEVWRARDTDGSEVALKLYALAGLTQTEADALHAALQRVHACLAGFAHPGVSRPGAPLRDDGFIGSTMPLAADDARSLRGAPAARVLPVLRTVAETVAALHAAGIVHRDLKPGNVLLDAAGRALLGDFGSAQRIGEGGPDAPYSRYTAGLPQRRGAPAAPEDDLHGLGALAYELLGGYPPRFPMAHGSVAADPPPAALTPVHPAPEGLCELVMALLDAPGTARPVDMAAAAAALRRIDAVAPAAAETVRVRALDAAEREQAAAGGGGRRNAVAAGVAGLLALLAAVFLWLPRMARTPVAEPAASAAAPRAAAGRPAAAAAGAEAEAALKEYATALAGLETRGAGIWGGAEFAAAKAAGAKATDLRDAGDLARAASAWREGTLRLGKVGAAAPEALAARLRMGDAALEAGQPESARQAFEVARLIDPRQVRAAAGLRRAGSLAAILPRLAEAESALLGERPLEAVTLYEQVLREDPAHPGARAGLARARSALGSDAYARAVGDALEALREGRADDARAALARARALRPGGAELAALEAQAQAAGARREFAATRGSLEALEAAERWTEALAGYEQWLARDATLEFARSGKARAAPRAELARRLEALLAEPARLVAPEVRREADRLLARADAVRGPAPVLRAQTSRLRGSLQVYDRPVAAVLQSDGLTQVTLQRVGTVGAFTRKELQLKPGRYVAIGSRPGYRDVRREFTLLPGGAAVVVEVRCTESVS